MNFKKIVSLFAASGIFFLQFNNSVSADPGQGKGDEGSDVNYGLQIPKPDFSELDRYHYIDSIVLRDGQTRSEAFDIGNQGLESLVERYPNSELVFSIKIGAPLIRNNMPPVDPVWIIDFYEVI